MKNVRVQAISQEQDGSVKFKNEELSETVSVPKGIIKN